MDFLSGVAKAIALLNRADFQVFVVTNQRCVAKGVVKASELEAIHQRMCRELAETGAIISAVYYCPHEKQPPCSCRKPEPGMLFAAAREHLIDLSASWIIGDSDADIQAGRKAGCKAARISGTPDSGNAKPDVVASSLLDAVRKILRWEDMIVDRVGTGVCDSMQRSAPADRS
jgi:D-glycero-D-manno-heptose 1,7-bisphosphate phosphatase